MISNFTTLLLSRRPRHAGEDWFHASSWFGGAPRLGTAPWPSDKSGEPLHFAAQLDLAEIASKIGQTRLPATGSLAFFIGGEGAVVHVPEGQNTTPVFPPPGTPDLTKSGGSEDWPYDLNGRPLFPYWPVHLSRLDLPSPPSEDADDADEQVDAFLTAQAAAVEAHFPRRKYNLTPDLAFAGPAIPDWWQNAIHLSDKLARASRDGQGALNIWRARLAQSRAGGDKDLVAKAEAAVAQLEAELAKLHEAQPRFKDFVAEVTAWTAGRDPWGLMSADELAQLEVYWKRNTEFPKLTGYHGIGEIDRLKADMLKALPAVGEPAYTALPAPVRDLVNAHRAPRPMWWHSAISYVASLEKAMRTGVPRASKSERDKIEADRILLASLRPSGALASLRRLVDGKGHEIAEIEARIASNEAKLAERRPAEVAFKNFVDEMSTRVAVRDPWQQMAQADIEWLKTALRHAQKEFGDFVRYIAPARIEDVEASTLRAMLTGEERAYASLPEGVQGLVNRAYLLPPNVWHQMFGRGLEIQGTSSAMREDGNIMLLQLTYDDLMAWSFGDNGAYQFWIAPRDLTDRNWSAAKLTFECH